MRSFSLTHLSDSDLLRDLASLVRQDRSTTACLIAHIAEVDARRLFLPAGYPSMRAYCVHELRLSEDSAQKRITAAREAQKYPVIFNAPAEGRLHLSAVVLLAPHLITENASELITAAYDKSKSEIDLMLAQRFPGTESLPLIVAVPGSSTSCTSCVEVAPGRPILTPTEQAARPVEHAPHPVASTAPHVAPPAPRSIVKPLAPQRYELRLSMAQATHDKLRRAQELLGHRIPSGDLAAVIDLALGELLTKLEKRKLGATDRPVAKPRPTTSKRHIPAQVKRQVSERDGSQCTFIGATGKRCPARSRLEFDHIVAVALGGEATVDNIRLRCHAHNQYSAERELGVEFMRAKRHEARAKGPATLSHASPAPA